MHLCEVSVAGEAISGRKDTQPPRLLALQKSNRDPRWDPQHSYKPLNMVINCYGLKYFSMVFLLLNQIPGQDSQLASFTENGALSLYDSKCTDGCKRSLVVGAQVS